jgi:magnesium-transporting ATPase (P-type)
MTGEEFRKAAGGIRADRLGSHFLEDPSAFANLINKRKIRVIARARPEDKVLLAVGLKELKRTVALTGEGINDIEGLRISDVGFSMGSGVSAAKDASKMILVDDNLMSIINAVLWGRNIYSNVRKFIQFQFTVNFSALVLILVVALVEGAPLFSVVQLLWINMIMDLMAALALAAEPPSPSTILNPPVRKGDNIITQVMWRQILGMTAYIVGMMVLMFFTIESILETQGKRLTLLFNTFIYLNLFNEINCRKVSADGFNVFEHIYRNIYFIAVFAATIGIQLVMV